MLSRAQPEWRATIHSRLSTDGRGAAPTRTGGARSTGRSSSGRTRVFWWTDDGESSETTSVQMYMDENDVVRAANALKLDRLAPCHFYMWKGARGDPKALHEHAASYPYPRVLEAAEVGDRLSVATPGVQPLRTLDDHDWG